MFGTNLVRALGYPVISLFCTLILRRIKDVGFNSDDRELFEVSFLVWKFVFADLLRIKQFYGIAYEDFSCTANFLTCSRPQNIHLMWEHWWAGVNWHCFFDICGVVPIYTSSRIWPTVPANILWHFKLSRQSSCKDSQSIRVTVPCQILLGDLIY